MAKHLRNADTLPAPAPDVSPAVPLDAVTLAPIAPPAPAIPLDASGRPNPYLDACNARWSASTWAGHTKRIGNAGGPGTGRTTDTPAPSRCYGCNAPFRGTQQPVTAADGYVWHMLCATLKDGGPGLPTANVQRAIPRAASTPVADAKVAALEANVAALAALVAQLTGALAGSTVAPAPAEAPAPEAPQEAPAA